MSFESPSPGNHNPVSHLSGNGEGSLDEDASPYEPKFGLELAPWGLEPIYGYEPGGFHPVHLGDVFGAASRYRVIHKLGNGGYATIWLCRDTATDIPTYKVLKIVVSDAFAEDFPELRVGEAIKALLNTGKNNDILSSLCLSSDQFEVRGPNGSHHCFVYPVLGPKASLGLFHTPEEQRNKALRNICYQLVRAVDYLHHQGICHGDITAKNAHQHISSIDGLSEAQVIQILGQPSLNPVDKIDLSTEESPSVPDYLVYPVDWTKVDIHHIKSQPCLIDLGESFWTSSPPEDLGTHRPYRSPELMLDQKPGLASDLWALACTLFEIRTGRVLFSAFDNDDDSYLVAIVTILGVLPEPWWSSTWGRRRDYYKDKGDELGRVIPRREEPPLPPNVSIHPSVAQGARSLQDKLAPGVWYMDSGLPPEKWHHDIPQREIEVFADLLGNLLRYRPEDRISAEEALSHEWFTM